jgi:hypothetical protein
MFLGFLEKMKDHASLVSEPKSACEEQQPSPHVIPLETHAMHEIDPLETSIICSGNESTCSLPTGKIALGSCVDGFGSSTFQISLMQFDKLGIENTITNPTPQL